MKCRAYQFFGRNYQAEQGRDAHNRDRRFDTPRTRTTVMASTTDSASLSVRNAAAAVEEWQRKRADEQKNLIAADMAPLTGYLKPISTAPPMWSFNGVGTTLLGHLRPSHHTTMYFSRLWIMFLCIPIIPLGIYLVNEVSHNRYQFFAKISSDDFHRIYSKSSIMKFYVLAACFSLAIGLFIFGLFAALSALGFHGPFRVRL
jgi:hypothetical protein